MAGTKETWKVESKSERPHVPYDLLYRGINLQEEIGSEGMRLLVPRIFLFGRQRRDEYSSSKRKQVEYALRTEGSGFLVNNPIVTCALTSGENIYLTIIDGHHRYRYSGGIFKTNNLPCIICTPKIIVDLINKHKLENKEIQEEPFIKELFEDIYTAIESFDSIAPDHKIIMPRSIPSITGIEKLEKMFKPFKVE